MSEVKNYQDIEKIYNEEIGSINITNSKKKPITEGVDPSLTRLSQIQGDFKDPNEERVYISFAGYRIEIVDFKTNRVLYYFTISDLEEFDPDEN